VAENQSTAGRGRREWLYNNANPIAGSGSEHGRGLDLHMAIAAIQRSISVLYMGPYNDHQIHQIRPTKLFYFFCLIHSQR
jgi:hypothetical protein